ncbi:MAG: hypothetical protein ACR2M0_03610 [Chloroflexia bacterium]
MNTHDEDMTRRLVHGLITLALTTLAGWLAIRITEMILGPEEKHLEGG